MNDATPNEVASEAAVALAKAGRKGIGKSRSIAPARGRTP